MTSPLTKQRFLNSLSKGGLIENAVLDEVITIGNVNFYPRITIVNCLFNYDIVFDSAEFIGSIEFIHCEFTGTISLLSCRNKPIRRTDSIDSSEVENFLIFTKCTAQSVLIEECKFSNGLTFRDQCKIGRLKIRELNWYHYQNGTIPFMLELDSSEFGMLQFRNFVCHKLNLSSSSISDAISGTDMKIGRFNIRKTVFKDCVIESLLECHLEIQDSVFKGVFRLESFDHLLDISNCAFEGETDLYMPRFDAVLHLTNITLLMSLQVRGDQFKEIKIDGGNRMSGEARIYSSRILILLLENNFSQFDLTFEKNTFQDIYISNYISKGSLSLLNSKFKGENTAFSLIASDLGKAKLMNFSFKECDSVTITDSFLSEISFTSTTWFTDNRMHSGRENYPEKRREVYRQLKQAAEKQGDKINSLEFQARELKAFKKMLSCWSETSLNDRLILILSETNDFGLSWLRPLWLLLVITLIFYLLIVVSISSTLKFAPATNTDELATTLVLFLENSSILIQMLNPAHNLSHMFSKNELTTSTYWLDGIHRIIAAFLLVQIVSAFRKFVKA